MLTTVRNYLSDLFALTGNGWNDFWFTPSGGDHLIWLRQLVGVFAFVWLASFTFELNSMFGDAGWLPNVVVHQAATGGSVNETAPAFSHLFYVRSAKALYATHAVCLGILGALVIGISPRITTPLSLLVVLSYIHRGPVVSTAFEVALCMLLFYLSIGACLGQRETVSMLRRAPDAERTQSWVNNLVTRLIQLHLCGFYLMIATSKLGTAAWWNGDAAWYLLTDTQHSLMNLEPLTTSRYLMDVVTHSWVGFELMFPVLIWVRMWRPLMIVVATVVWLLTALLTGQVGYCLLMAAANLAFVSQDFRTFTQRPATDSLVGEQVSRP